jgi:hypothetical protein
MVLLFAGGSAGTLGMSIGRRAVGALASLLCAPASMSLSALIRLNFGGTYQVAARKSAARAEKARML